MVTRPWQDDGELDVDRVEIKLIEITPSLLDDERIAELYDMACDLLDEVKRLRGE